PAAGAKAHLPTLPFVFSILVMVSTPAFWVAEKLTWSPACNSSSEEPCTLYRVALPLLEPTVPSWVGWMEIVLLSLSICVIIPVLASCAKAAEPMKAKSAAALMGFMIFMATSQVDRVDDNPR